MPHRRPALVGKLRARDDALAFLAMARHLEAFTAGGQRHVADVMEEGRRAETFEVARRDAGAPADGVCDRDDAARMALRDGIAMVDRVRRGDHDLRTGLGEHRHEVAVRPLELRYELG